MPEYINIAKIAVRLAHDMKELKGKFPTSIVGLVGELLVMSKLSEKQLKFRVKGGQAGYDLELENGKKIEVRTSLLKNEGVFSKKDIVNYGWRLKDKGKEIKFDYIICVALNEQLIENSECYLLTKEEVEEAPQVRIPRFSKVEKRLWIYPSISIMREAQKDKPDYFLEWERNINYAKNKYLLENRWDVLLS